MKSITKNKPRKRLSQKQIAELECSIYFLHIAELKDICHELELTAMGKKLNLINRIIHFIKTNEIILEPIIPAISKSQPGITYNANPG